MEADCCTGIIQRLKTLQYRTGRSAGKQGRQNGSDPLVRRLFRIAQPEETQTVAEAEDGRRERLSLSRPAAVAWTRACAQTRSQLPLSQPGDPLPKPCYLGMKEGPLRPTAGDSARQAVELIN